MAQRLKLSALVTVLVVACAAWSARADEWKEFSSAEGRFAVEFPGTPQQAKQPMPTKVGTLDAKITMLALPDNVFYGVFYLDYPKAALEHSTADDLLDGARDSAVKRVKGGRLDAEEKIALAGSPGRQLGIDAPGDLRLTVRMYLVKNRLYQVISSVARTKEKQADPRRFLDSFRLSGEP
jgi:hypothetical protein